MARKPQLQLKASILQLFGESTYRALEKSQFTTFPNPTPERLEKLRKTVRECFMESVRCKDHKVLSWLTATALLKHLSPEMTLGMCANLLAFGEKARNGEIEENDNYRQVTAGIYRLLREKPSATTRRLTPEQIQNLRQKYPEKKGLATENHNLFTLCAVFNDAKVLQQLIRKSTREGQPVSLQGLLNSYRDSAGQTAAHLAVTSRSKDVLDWLKSNAKGAFVYPDKNKETALVRLFAQAQSGDRFAQTFLFQIAMEKCTEGAKISKGAGTKPDPEEKKAEPLKTKGSPGPKSSARIKNPGDLTI
jgi:hypothetical protein